MTDQERQFQIDSFQKKYKGRRGFKDLFKRAQREAYRDDILQPFQPACKQKWWTAWKNRQLVHDSIDREVIRKEQELEQIYRQKPKGVTTLEEKVLKEIHREHPTMMSEEEIIKWN